MNMQLGSMHAASFATDPKHLGFTLRRYHFVARMLRGARNVLEVGCGDCTGAWVVLPAVQHLEGCDPSRWSGHDVIRHHMHNMVEDGPLSFDGAPWDAIYSLDVLEHIAPSDEGLFFSNINASLAEHGTVIIGSPSLESQPYASELSKQHHVNCKTGEQLCETLQWHYHNVFLLGLNDYALHDGFDAMVHYRLAICTGKR